MLRITNIKIELDYKITGTDSLNKIYSGKHWSIRKEYASKIKMLVRNELHKSKHEVFKNKVVITFTFPIDKLDIDNHAYFVKCVIDALKGKVIKDDDFKYVVGLIQVFKNRKNILVEVEEIC